MLEIRYNKNTKELTGWWGNRYGNHEVKLRNRPDEAMAMLDIGILDKDLSAWLFDGDKLIPNPAYVEPLPCRELVPEDYLAEITVLKAEIDELKARMDNRGLR